MNQPALTMHLTESMEASEAIPEKMLCMAILQRAILDYLKLSKCSEGFYKIEEQATHNHMTARKWFAVRYNGCAPAGSFEWCCEALDLDPMYMRKFILLAKSNNERYFKTRWDSWFDFFTADDLKEPEFVYLASKR